MKAKLLGIKAHYTSDVVVRSLKIVTAPILAALIRCPLVLAFDNAQDQPLGAQRLEIGDFVRVLT